MKQFACWFTHGVGNGSELRRIVHAARTPSEVVEKVESFFESRTAAGVSRSSAAQDVSCTANAGKEDPAHGPLDADRLEATLGA
jgi:hypothetical protein